MLYYEDMVPGGTLTGATFLVDEAEMVAFAERWDPVPFHIDKKAGEKAFGSLTAPGVFVLAIKQHLIHRLEETHAIIASIGYDEVRFHHPVRPGDALTLKLEWVDRRVSQSKPDRGIVTLRLSLENQDAAVVMSHLDTILVHRREPAS